MRFLMRTVLVAAFAMLLASPQTALAAGGEHPRINSYSHAWEYDWELDDYVYVLTLNLTSDGIDVVPFTMELVSFNPATGPFSVTSTPNGSGTLDQAQVEDFGHYLTSIISCQDSDTTAHVYDSPSTWNAASPQSILTFASIIGQLRFQSFGCSSYQPPPIGQSPPPGPCDASAAPVIDEFVEDSSSFFYVTVELENDASVILGFEFDGDQWELSEQYGNPGSCSGQLDTFADYTSAILTSSTCSAPPAYTPAEQSTIAWYVSEVQGFCQNNSCNDAAAPFIDELEPDSSSFFYVTIETENNSSITLGFEYDGDRWELAEQYGYAGICSGQVTTFGDYTMSILTSPSCTAAPAYTTAEESAIAWYVAEVEDFCQNNQ